MEAKPPVALAEVLARNEDEVVVSVGPDPLLAEVIPLRRDQVSLSHHFVPCEGAVKGK